MWANGGMWSDVGHDELSPDLQLIRHLERFRSVPVFALMVGFAHSSEKLKERAKELILQTPVKVCMMVDIKESPVYENPLVRDKKNWDILESQSSTITMNDSVRYLDKEEETSPILIYEIPWAGRLTGVVQVFAKDLVTGGIIEETPKMVSDGS